MLTISLPSSTQGFWLSDVTDLLSDGENCFQGRHCNREVEEGYQYGIAVTFDKNKP